MENLITRKFKMIYNSTQNYALDTITWIKICDLTSNDINTYNSVSIDVAYSTDMLWTTIIIPFTRLLNTPNQEYTVHDNGRSAYVHFKRQDNQLLFKLARVKTNPELSTIRGAVYLFT